MDPGKSSLFNVPLLLGRQLRAPAPAHRGSTYSTSTLPAWRMAVKAMMAAYIVRRRIPTFQADGLEC